MIQIKNLNKNFDKLKAVDSLSFEVKKGDILGFLGPNGAGKTTTIKMIAGFLTPDAGSVFIDGKEFKDGDIEIKKKIGYMPEDTPLYKEMTTREYLEFIAEIHNLEDREKKIDDIIESTNLKTVEHQLIETLSKGYKSRLSFASSILHNPPILLLDEPTDGLDPNQKNEIRKLIKDLSKEKAIIISTHILEEVKAVCNRVFVISNGKKLLDGTPKEMQKYGDKDEIVISIQDKDKINAEKIIGKDLTFFGESKNSSDSRYIFHTKESINEITKKLNGKVNFCEIFYYDSTLDNAFRKMTQNF